MKAIFSRKSVATFGSEFAGTTSSNFTIEIMKLFVTVGTTRFDALINKISTPLFLSKISKAGFTHLTLQIGNSPCILKSEIHPDIHIDIFDFTTDVQAFMRTSDLIISHAGAGSILDAIECSAGLIVCVNENLMDNHQTELAEEMNKLKMAIMCTPKTLLDVFDEWVESNRNIRAGERPKFDFDNGVKLNSFLEKHMFQE